jgi:multiple sugar transport system substrate-binding protein
MSLASPIDLPTRRSRWSVTRRALLATAASGAATAALAACGTPSRTTTTESAPAATRPTGDIELWHNWATRAPQLRVYLDRFEQQYPGTKVLDQDATQLGGRPKMTASVIAGTMPDCLMVFKDMYPLVVPAKAMVGLNKYVARDKIDLKQFGEADVKDRTFGGELVVLPSASGVTGPALFLYWNKDHFKQVGLNPEQGPKTWAELETYAVRLVRPGERLGVNPTGRLFLWLHTNNGRFYADEGRKAGFDTPETRDALRYVSQLVQRQGVAEMEEYGLGNPAFFQGKYAMFFSLDNFPSALAADAIGKQIDWGITTMPVNEKNGRAKFQIPTRGQHGYGVTAQAKNPEGAWALAKFLTLTDAQCDFMTKDQGRFSTLKRCNTTPEMLKRPEFQVFSKAVDSVVSLPFSPGDDAAIAALEKHATSAALGKTSLDAAMIAAVQEAQNALDEGWKTWRA